MRFEKSDRARKIGQFIGFMGMFFIFTTILFFMLKITHRFPESWNYFYVIGITCCIALVGECLRWWLK